VLLALIYFPVFSHLDTLSVRQYDEARNAMNAYEMHKNGNYIVTHFEGKPDMWNSKPPLLNWCQVAFMKVIGVNELAVRLPSAIATLLICILLLWFSKNYLNNEWLGIIAVLVLITSKGFISIHASRTGDYDTLQTLFTTLGGLLSYWYCEKQKTKHLYLFFICFALAVLTKSISGLLFIPAILIYSIFRRQFIPLLKSKHFYLGLTSFLILVLGYYLLREMQNPGFIAAVQENELGGRYLEVLDQHQQPFFFYLQNILDYRFKWWIFLLPFGLITGLISKNQRVKNLTVFSGLMVLVLLLVISSSQTKLAWYDVPMYPFFALLVATFVSFLFNALKKLKWLKNPILASLIPLIFLAALTFWPYKKILKKTVKPKEEAWIAEFYQISYFLKDAIKGKHDLNGQFVIFDKYHPHVLFYLAMLNEQGVNVSNTNWKELKPNSLVVVHQVHLQDYIEENYTYELALEKGKIKKYKILTRK